MANYGNLVPEWLMSDISQLLQYQPEGVALSKKDFEEEYMVGEMDPLGPGQRRYYFDYDFTDADRHRYTPGSGTPDIIAGFSEGRQEGYRFYDKQDAYTAYMDSLGMQDLGQVEGVNIFDPKSLVEGIQKARGSKGHVDPGMYTAFTPDMFKGLHTGAYQEDIEEGRGSLLDTLMASTKRAQSLGGGLAGYGQRGAQKGVAQQSYLGGVEDIYAGVDEQKSATLQNISDVLGQYETI